MYETAKWRQLYLHDDVSACGPFTLSTLDVALWAGPGARRQEELLLVGGRGGGGGGVAGAGQRAVLRSLGAAVPGRGRDPGQRAQGFVFRCVCLLISSKRCL